MALWKRGNGGGRLCLFLANSSEVRLSQYSGRRISCLHSLEGILVVSRVWVKFQFRAWKLKLKKKKKKKRKRHWDGWGWWMLLSNLAFLTICDICEVKVCPTSSRNFSVSLTFIATNGYGWPPLASLSLRSWWIRSHFPMCIHRHSPAHLLLTQEESGTWYSVEPIKYFKLVSHTHTHTHTCNKKKGCVASGSMGPDASTNLHFRWVKSSLPRCIICSGHISTSPVMMMVMGSACLHQTRAFHKRVDVLDHTLGPPTACYHHCQLPNTTGWIWMEHVNYYI